MRHVNNALRRLDHVFAAVDHGSLRQAARALCVRESSVSRNIVALEQLLDIQLFDRDVRGVRLTDAGRAWIGNVRACYEGLHEALAGCGSGQPDAKTLKIGLCAPMGRAFVTRLIDRFASLHPDVPLSIEDIAHEQSLAAIRRRQLDIAFSHGFASAPSCQSENFGQERLFVLLPTSHRLADRQAIAWADLAGACLLVPAGPEGSQINLCLLEDIVAGGGPSFQLCRASEATVILKVQLGHGLTLAGESLARTIGVGPTVWKPIAGPNSNTSITAVWLESNPKRALLRLIGTGRNMLNPSIGAPIVATSINAKPRLCSHREAGGKLRP